MIDAVTRTREPLNVSTDGTAGPHSMVPVSELSALRQLLDHHRVRYSVDEEAISLDGGPETVVFDLNSGADIAVIQAILESIR